MRNTLIIIMSILSLAFAKAQTIDTVQVFESNNTLKIKIEGYRHSSGITMSQINYDIKPDEVNIDLFFTYCSGYTVIIPFDTIIDLGISSTQQILFKCRTIKDLNPGSQDCPQNNTLSTIDSLSYLYDPTKLADKSATKQEISIYPNPFNEYIIIENTDLDEEYSIIITDLNGRIVVNRKVITANRKIDLKELKEGVYTIKILSKNKEEINRRILKVGE